MKKSLIILGALVFSGAAMANEAATIGKLLKQGIETRLTDRATVNQWITNYNGIARRLISESAMANDYRKSRIIGELGQGLRDRVEPYLNPVVTASAPESNETYRQLVQAIDARDYARISKLAKTAQAQLVTVSKIVNAK